MDCDKETDTIEEIIKFDHDDDLNQFVSVQNTVKECRDETKKIKGDIDLLKVKLSDVSTATDDDCNYCEKEYNELYEESVATVLQIASIDLAVLEDMLPYVIPAKLILT